MKTVQVSDLSGAALDWAVAMAEGLEPLIEDGKVYTFINNESDFMLSFEPSIDWRRAGPIIERENILLNVDSNGGHCAQLFGTISPVCHGATKLEAVMRAYVSHKLGNTIEVPAVLVEGEA